MLNKIVYLRDPHPSEPIIFNSDELYTKRILLTTTSLVLAAGAAHAEVTFSGKAEFGVNRTAKAAAVAAVAGVENEAFAAANATEGGTPITTGVDIAAKAATGSTADASDATTLAAANAKALLLQDQDLAELEVASTRRNCSYLQVTTTL